MGFAIGLLIILAVSCALGSFIPQGETYAAYAEMYSERTAGWILALGLEDVYHSPWFIVIAVFLCLNLLLCNLVRIPQILRRYRAAGEMPEDTAGPSGEGDQAAGPLTAACGDRAEAESLMKHLGIRAIREGRTAEGRTCLYGVRGRAGLWGAWVCHLGVLLLILGFGLGQTMKQEYTVYGLPGDSRQVGDTSYIVTIEDFRVDLREDDTVEQYTADLTVRDVSTGAVQQGTTQVNAPARMFGMTFYQNSTGWAAGIRVDKNGQLLQDENVCAGDYLEVADKPDLVIMLTAFYPDVRMTDQGPMTASSDIVNPGYLYMVYYQGQVLGMNVLMQDEELTIDEYTVTFHDPQNYTLIQIRRDPFTPLALAGGLVTLLGLFLAFYCPLTQVWAVEKREEEGGKGWTVRGRCPKGGILFRERFKEAADKL